MTTSNSHTNVLVPGTEYLIKRASRIQTENGPKLLLWLHVADHSLICYFPTDLGHMLTDQQIQHVNNETRILTGLYIGINPHGEHIFQIRDRTSNAAYSNTDGITPSFGV